MLNLHTIRPILKKGSLLVLNVLLSCSAFAGTFTVSNTNNTGAGSLRQAIINANAAGAGPHAITFTTSGTIVLSSVLPAINVSGVTLDGGGNIAISGNTTPVSSFNLISLGANASNATIKGVTLQNTNGAGISMAGGLTGVTVQDVLEQSTIPAVFFAQGILVSGASTNLTVRNVRINNVRAQYAYVYYSGIALSGNTTGFTADNLRITSNANFGIYLTGNATNWIIRNSTIDMDDPNSAVTGGRGINFGTPSTGTISNILIDSTQFHDAIQSIYLSTQGATINGFTLKKCMFDHFDGEGLGAYDIYEPSSSYPLTGLTIDSCNFNGDVRNTTADIAYNIYLSTPAAVKNLTITNSVFNQSRSNGVYLGFNNLNTATISGNTFSNNGAGYVKSGGLLLQTTSQTSQSGAVTISNNQFTNSNGSAIYIDGSAQVVPNMTISGNTITGTKTSNGTIVISNAQKIKITQNSIYNNVGLGIELLGGNCGYEGIYYTPSLSSSVETAPGVYDLTFQMPAICGTGKCTIELFATEAAATGIGGQHHLRTVTGLSAGLQTMTGVTGAAPELTTAPYGSFTATLTIPSNNCGTSEFSNKLAIKTIGPAGVNGAALWLNPDFLAPGNLVNGTGWQDFSGTNNHFTLVTGAIPRIEGGNNFNNYVKFTGTQGLRRPSFTSAYAAGETFSVARSTAASYGMYDFGSFTRPSTYSDASVHVNFGTADKYGWNPITKAVQDGKPGTTITGRSIDTKTWNIFSAHSGVNDWGVDFNGGMQTVKTSVNTPYFYAITENYIGRDIVGGYIGDFAEQAVYSRVLTNLERQRINTYFAIKYGITLNQNYLASDGTTVWWDVSANAFYSKGIAGLAKDVVSVLHQKQARSNSTPDVITIGMGNVLQLSNALNSATIRNDKSAFVWGTDSGSTAFATAFVTSYSNVRMARRWKVQKTNWNDTLIVIKLAGGNANKNLIISTDQTFATGVQNFPLNDTGAVVLNSSVFANGAYFTFSNSIIAPACVAAGLQGWYRADDVNAAGSKWTDFSGNDRHAVQATAASQPALVTNATNFNPAFNFDGSNDYMDIPANLGISGTNNFTMLSMTTRKTVGTTAAILSQQGSITNNYLTYYTANKYSIGNTGVGSINSTGTYPTANVPLLQATTRNTGNVFSLYTNGGADGGGTNAYSFTTNNLRIGNRAASADIPFNGYINEVIVYNRALTTTELNQVQSYLALKYGVTLNQAAPQDYISSNASVTMWKASDNTGYANDIIGIGRDDCGRFNQKQTQSINSGSVLTLALGNQIAADNKSNTATPGNNLSFLATGSNGLDAVNYATAVAGTNVTARMARSWKMDKTNWADQNITLKAATGMKNTYLIVSTDPGFATISQELPMTASDSTITINSSLIPDGAYFTFAKAVRGPGAVHTGVALWLRADDGTATSAYWEDYSGNAHDGIQATAANQALFRNGATNFNPALTFDGTNDYLDISHNLGLTGTNNFSVFSVSTRNTVGTDDALLAQQNNPTNGFASYISSVNKYTIGSSTVGVQNTTGTYSTAGIPYLNATTRTGNAFSLYTNGGADGGGTAAYNFPTTNMRVGGRQTSADMAFAGNINELAVYNRALSASEIVQVQSYLAYKYGITINQAIPSSYIATDGVTKMWDAGTSNLYKNNIAGIGRDDNTDLYQRQSASVNDTSLTIAVGDSIAATNQTSPGAFSDDLSFMSWADNNLATTLSTAITGGNATLRMPRVWKMQKVNFTDVNITLKPARSVRYLLVNATDSTFATGTTNEYTFNAATGAITVNSGVIPNGAYFTFGTRVVGPGCVNAGIDVWLRADKNAAGNNWSDFSGNGRDALQGASANQPASITSSLNYNPALTFDGTDDWMGTPPIPASEYANNTYFVVNTTADISAGDFIGAGNSGSSYMGLGHISGGSVRYYEPGVAVIATFGQVSGVPSIAAVSQTAAAGGINIYKNGNLVINGSIAGSTFPNAASMLEVGRRAIAAGSPTNFTGDLQEVVMYNRVLSAFEMDKVNSYLGLKYGFTIANGTKDYVASDWNGTTGTKFWTADATYKTGITGIGRDDCDQLYQKQSRNVEGGLVSIAIGSGIANNNGTNANEIPADNSYMVFADNNAAAQYTATVTGANVNVRMARVWKTDKTNWTDSIVTLKLNGKTGGIYLLISTDPTFATIAQELSVNSSDSTISFNSSLIPDGAFFTFGKNIIAPGGVIGSSVWMRADMGTGTTANNTAVITWQDASPYENDVTQATGSRQPSYRDNGADNINFNPVLSFDGADVLTKTPGMLGANAYTGTALFLVDNASSLAAAARPVWEPTTANFLGLQTNATATSYSFNYGTTVVSGAPAITANNTYLFSANSGASSHILYKNAAAIATSATAAANYTGNNSALSIGADATPANFFTGRIPEVIGYTQTLTPGQMQRVNSYLAVKYGLTLDQATPYSYVATDSTVIWDATGNAAYKYSIAGIGRDDMEVLMQKQSRSSDTTRMRVVVGTGDLAESNTANTGSFGLDKSYLLWGDNNASPLFTTAIAGNPAVNSRMGRIWKVQETGSVGQVQVAYPLNVLANPDNSYLVISNDATFDGTDQFLPLTQIKINGKKHFAAYADLNNGQYFTVAAQIKSPGGVGAAALWMRADKGIDSNVNNTPVDEWTDYTSQINSGKQEIAVNQPLFMNNAADNANFNPVVKFDGSNDNFVLDINRLPVGASARTIIGYGKPANVSGVKSLIGWGTNTAPQYIGIGANAAAGVVSSAYTTHPVSAAALWTAGTNNEVFATLKTGANGVNLYSKMKLLATNTIAMNTTGTQANIGGGAGLWNGNIGEVIVFDRELDSLERQRVTTYMAIKYGYTMDQTVAHDYLATDGTTKVWDATLNAAYKNSITGIGRDDMEGLNQLQSTNTDATRLQIVAGTEAIAAINSANTGFIGQDKSYFVWGDDNAAANAWSATDAPTGRERITREWKVQETGIIGNVAIQVPANTSPLTNKLPLERNGKAYLLVSSNGTFGTGAAEVQMTLNGTMWEAAYDFKDGDYFTFATADNCAQNSAVVLARGTVKAVSSFCNVGPWNRYLNPDALTDVLVAINPNGNVFNPTSVTVDVSGTFDSTAYTDLSHVAQSATDSSKVAMRMVSIVAPGTFNVNGGVKMRIYFDPAEFNTPFPVFGPNIYTGWFKHPQHTKAGVLSALTPGGLTGMVQITPDTIGQEDGIYYAEFSHITSFSTFGYLSSTFVPVVLPLRLEYFTWHMEQCKTIFDWKTATEQNSQKTEIEASTDGLHFSKIGEVAAKNTANGATYSFGYGAFSGRRYFRLKLMDKDGTATYSNTVTINGCSSPAIIVSPNPVKNQLTISGLSGVSQVQLFDHMGRELQVFTTDQPIHTLDMSRYTAGTYVVRITGTGNVPFTQKVTKTDE